MEYILCLLLAVLYSAGAENCVVDVKQDFGSKGPLIISPGATKFVYPNIKTPSLLSLKKNERLRVSCPGNSILLNNQTADVHVAEITCDSGKKFKIGKSSINFANITCQKHAKAIVKSIGKSCAVTGKIYVIGFEIDDGNFIPNIELCHDSGRAHTYWSHGIIVSTIQSRQRQARKNTFGVGKLFVSVPVKKAYTLQQQALTFLSLFKNPKWADQYVSELEHKFFARGHLVANADEFYGDQQESTFFFVNVVPMWQAVNNGNWKRVEELVRSTAKKKKTDLNVWTGSIGTLTLRDKDDQEVEIYLTNATVDGEHNMIPAPKVLFKYVYDSKSNKGLVFLTSNNPYAKKNEIQDYVICKKYDGCGDELGSEFEAIESGYTYCCTVRDFLKNEDIQQLSLPDFSDAEPLFQSG